MTFDLMRNFLFDSEEVKVSTSYLPVFLCLSVCPLKSVEHSWLCCYHTHDGLQSMIRHLLPTLLPPEAICIASLCSCFHPCFCPSVRAVHFHDVSSIRWWIFCQTVVVGAPWDKDKLIRFEVKCQMSRSYNNIYIATEASSTRHCRVVECGMRKSYLTGVWK